MDTESTDSVAHWLKADSARSMVGARDTKMSKRVLALREIRV